MTNLKLGLVAQADVDAGIRLIREDGEKVNDLSFKLACACLRKLLKDEDPLLVYSRKPIDRSIKVIGKTTRYGHRIVKRRGTKWFQDWCEKHKHRFDFT